MPEDRWREISAYAKQFFPKTTIPFIDLHAALAHAMAGDGDELVRIAENPHGPAGELVRPVTDAYRAMARQDWAEGATVLTGLMGDHARLGGSRAQRDLLEFSLLNALLKQGWDTEASRLLSLRRPTIAAEHAVHGLSVH